VLDDRQSYLILNSDKAYRFVRYETHNSEEVSLFDYASGIKNTGSGSQNGRTQEGVNSINLQVNESARK